MESQDYRTAKHTVAIEVARSTHEVFAHLLNDVSKFWPEEFEGKSARLYDEFVFRTGDSHYSKNKVVELAPNKKVVWLVTESIRKTDNFDWTGSKMTFELTPKGNNTRIEFTYNGLILANEYDRLVQICDMVIKEDLYKFMTNKGYTITIEVAKTPQDVFACICEVPKWWTKDFDGGSKQLNDEFVIHHPGQHYSKQKVVEVVPGKKIVWLVTESTLHWLRNDKTEWTNTKMIFEITYKGGKTLLRFRHEGLIPAKECYARCRQGWNMVITSGLFDFITLGRSITG